MKKRRLLLTALAIPALAAPPLPPAGPSAPGDTPQNDPVVKAREARAAAQGINERDLPPVPKTLVEPPPLPPPETHPKDMPGYRAKHRRGRHHKKRVKTRRAAARPHRAARHK
ncbi:MAG: hypothetical protein JST05_04700 [Acidobacteria bacterium]|nr:hypothetical protein [Acidobacteriota bacterium]